MTGRKVTKTRADSYQFREVVQRAFKDTFGIDVETEYSIIHMASITTRVDNKKFTPSQVRWLKGFEDGWLARGALRNREGR